MRKILLTILLMNSVVGQLLNAQDNLILIHGGSYKMGDFTGKRYERERPVHDVFLDSYYMSMYQLAVGEFRDFVEESGYITDCERKRTGKGLRC